MHGLRPTRSGRGSESLDLFQAQTTALKACEAAGDLIRGRLLKRLVVHEKGSSGDVVTSLDFASEKLIIKAINAKFPHHKIISEERGAIDRASRWTWLIDPVDGTNNVVIGLMVITVGVTLCQDEVPVVSVVHDPVSRRTWSAILERGARQGDHALVTKPRPDASRKPTLAWIQGYSVQDGDRTARALRMVMGQRGHRVLDLWAPLTCWMMLARGDIDGIVGYRIGELDLHGGALIADEAGLTIHEFSGIPFEKRFRGTGDSQCVLAGSSEVVSELTEMVSTARRLADELDHLVSAELLKR